MSSRHEPSDLAVQRADLQACDTLLTRLSHGNDPSYGSDPLLASLVSLRDEVATNAEHSEVPDVLALLGDVPVEINGHAAEAHAEPGGADTEEGAHVVSLARHRKQKQRPQWVSTLTGTAVGAVAASAMILVGGSAVYNADPGTSLWGARLAVFGEPNTQMVELTSTLEEADKLRGSGDIEGAKRLVAQARELIAYLDQRDQAEARKHVEHADTVLNSEKPEPLIVVTTTTTTETISPSRTRTAQPSGQTVTETSTVMETVTSIVTVSPEPAEGTGASDDVQQPGGAVPGGANRDAEPEPRNQDSAPAPVLDVNDARDAVSDLLDRGTQRR